MPNVLYHHFGPDRFGFDCGGAVWNRYHPSLIVCNYNN